MAAPSRRAPPVTRATGLSDIDLGIILVRYTRFKGLDRIGALIKPEELLT